MRFPVSSKLSNYKIFVRISFIIIKVILSVMILTFTLHILLPLSICVFLRLIELIGLWTVSYLGHYKDLILGHIYNHILNRP